MIMKKIDLLDALSHTDEQMLQSAAMSMSATPKMSKSAFWGRVGAIAAGFALVLTIGVVSLPMLMADTPADTTPQGAVQNTQTQVPEQVATPSALQLISLSETQEGGGSPTVSSVADSFWSNGYMLMTFDTKVGETVTVTSYWDGLFERAYPQDGHEMWEGLDPNSIEDRKTYISTLSGFRHAIAHVNGEYHLTIDPTETYIMWAQPQIVGGSHRLGSLVGHHKHLNIMETRFGKGSLQYQKAWEEYQAFIDECWGDENYGERILEGNENILTYRIKNAEGEIVAVGAMYVYRQYLLDDADNHWYKDLYISRYADLGYVRFETPMSAEEADSYLADMYATIDDVKAGMDFTPTTEGEFYMSGLADLLNNPPFERPEGDWYTTQGFGHSSADNYCTYHIGFVPKTEEVVSASHADYVFRIYDDGTWQDVTDEELNIGEQDIVHIPEA